MNQDPKIVVLIISTDKTNYERQAKNVWRMYMNKIPDVKCLFIEMDNTIDEEMIYKRDSDLIKIKGVESIKPGVFLKTIYSFKLVIKEFQNADYFIRTNLSSVWNFKKLFEILPKRRIDNYVLAKKIAIFPSGCGVVLSRNIVETMSKLEYTSKFLNSHNDDVLIGYVLKQVFGIQDYNNGYYFHDLENLPDKNVYHVRCKLGHDFEGITIDDRVRKEIPYMKKLVKMYYYNLYIDQEYLDVEKKIIVVGDFYDKDIEYLKGRQCKIIRGFSSEQVCDLMLCDTLKLDNDQIKEVLNHCYTKRVNLKIVLRNNRIDFINLIKRFKIKYDDYIVYNVDDYIKNNKQSILDLEPV